MKRILLTAIGAFCLHGALMAQAKLKPAKSPKKSTVQSEQVTQDARMKEKLEHFNAYKTGKKPVPAPAAVSDANKAEDAKVERSGNKN